jgi:SAM-dependent methyltransferase
VTGAWMTQEIRIKGNSDLAFTSNSSEFYRNYWAGGEKISATTRARNELLLNRFFPTGIFGKEVLEIGVGGEGGLIHMLKDKNRVYGIDVSQSARSNCEKLGLGVLVKNLDRERIPFEDNCIDLVFAFEVFEHFSNPQFVLEEIRRVLRPKGHLLISTPNPVIHHWPRLFYPELFEENAFLQFLMINMFQLIRKENLGSNVYKPLLDDDRLGAWSWCWFCSKIGPDAVDVLFAQAMYLWSLKDDHDIRRKPVEAVDLFRKCCELDKNFVLPRFMLARALVYRLIYGEQAEFFESLMFLKSHAFDAQSPHSLAALEQFAKLYIDLKRFGLNLIDRRDFDAAIARIEQYSQFGRRQAVALASRR